MTPLDRAHAAMDAGGDAERVQFFEALAAAELFVLLEEGEVPRVFETEDGMFLLVFDQEARLAEFAEGPAPYAALSGRSVAEMIGGKGIGLGLNLGVAPSSILLPADAITWLAEMLGHTPEEVTARPERFDPPGALPEAFLASLDARLAAAAGLAEQAYLAAVTYEGGRKGHVLAIVGAEVEAEAAMAQSVSDAMTLSGIEAGELDVVFITQGDAAVAKLEAVGLRFDLPDVPAPSAPVPDPTKPPKLR